MEIFMFSPLLKKLTLGLCLGLTLSTPLLAKENQEVLSESGKDVGSGGGGLTINGKSYTFAELGIKPEEEETTPYSNEVLNEINRLLNPEVTGLDGAKDKILENILRTDKKYINVDIVDTSKFRKILSDYQSALGDQFDPKKFQVYAITDQVATYIFPAYYTLDVGQQAGILIHENFFRLDTQIPLKQILNFDYQLRHFHSLLAQGKKAKKVDLQFSLLDLDNVIHSHRWIYTSPLKVFVTILKENTPSKWWQLEKWQGDSYTFVSKDGILELRRFGSNHSFQIEKIDIFKLNKQYNSYTPKEIRYLTSGRRLLIDHRDCIDKHSTVSLDVGKIYVSLKELKLMIYESEFTYVTCDIRVK